MFITNIKLQNFRNYEKQEINLDENINIFYGENAQGKTNILEAIFISAMGKSFRAKRDNELIKFGEKEACIEIVFEKENREKKIKVNINEKKQIILNGIKITKLSELLGNLNIVIFSPDDINVLKDGPQKRRKFLNMMISQLKPGYIYYFNLYKKTLEQRNNFLKQIKFKGKSEQNLEIWDESLSNYAEKIHNYRLEYIKKINNKIKKIHENITQKKENIEMEYISDFKNKEEFYNLLKINRKKDIEKGYTTKGIHRDDFNIYINNNLVNIYGSQGQHRTAMLSLKLSELYIIKDEINEFPILLLDDFMSELDEKRIKNFLNNIENTQVIITGTEKIILEKNKINVYNVKQGIVKEK